MLGLNQLLIRKDGKYLLLDTGLGEKWQPDEIGLLDFEEPRRLLTELEKVGVGVSDIDIVILTHLHYDHSGGVTQRTPSSLAPTFTNALYYVQETELSYAQRPQLRHKDDYRKEDFEPIIASGQLVAVNGAQTIIPGVEVHLAPGHSPGHQVVVVKGDETLLFQGDLFAVPEHANLSVFTSFDVDEETLKETRSEWIGRAKSNEWKCVFCHAVRNPVREL